MAGNPLAPLADENISAPLAAQCNALSDATYTTYDRQSGPADRRRYKVICRANPDHRPWSAQLDRFIWLVHRHPLGPFRRGAVCDLAGTTFAIPGYLVWAAIVYAVAGTAISHWIGKPLAPLNFAQQRYEADFRFNLVRVRENSEQIALLGGETIETDRLNARFDSVVTNWHRIMSRQKRLAFFTAGYSQAAIIFPFIVLSPAYFSGAMQLGGLVQTAAAFGAVQVALSFFVNIYPTFAQWLAVIARLNGFEQSVEAASAATAAAAPSRVDVVWHPATSELAVTGLAVQLPAGTPLIAAEDLVIKTGERTLITGPSGSGKSTFFRAVAGIWPFGTGTVTVPRGAKCMVLPQRPYFFLGSLEEAVAYPSDRGTFELAYIAEVLTAVRLPALAMRLVRRSSLEPDIIPGRAAASEHCSRHTSRA